MLVEFSVTNFLSFKNKATLSMVKAKGKELEETNTISVDAPATPDLVRSAVIYGANAAGKSNLIKAIGTMRKIVVESSQSGQIGDQLPVTPFLFDQKTEQQPSDFEVIFIQKGVRYRYGFSTTKERIIEEWLYAYPKGRPQAWIERIYDEEKAQYIWGKMSALSGQKQNLKNATRENSLFLSTAVQLNNKQLFSIFTWFFKKRVFYKEIKSSLVKNISRKEKARKKIVDFLNSLDMGIYDIEIQENSYINSNNFKEFSSTLPKDLTNTFRQQFKDEKNLKIKTIHKTKTGDKILLDIEDESDGTQKIFNLSTTWMTALNIGQILIIDELNTHLHPSMVRHLIQMFHSPIINKNGAQLIFTTHDTTILDNEVFRRDQIWFCEKDDEQSTELYPLTDFHPRKEGTWSRGYLKGRYGAVPYLSDFMNR